MFKCKVCIEKDSRIKDLKENIQFLQNEISPRQQIPLINLEANNILNGAGLEEPSPEEIEQLKREKEERDALLSGNYN